MDVISTRRLSSLPDLYALAPEWRELWNRCPSATPFQRPEWLLPWIESFTPRELWVIEARRENRLVGLAPMFIWQRAGERVMAPVGAGISDYLDWLVDPVVSTECLPLLLRRLGGAEWDTMELMDLSSDSPLLQHWQHGGKEESCAICPGLRFDPGTPFNKIVPSHQRRNLKTAENRMRRAGISRVELATRETLPEFIAMLIKLHGSRWTELGGPGVLEDPKVQDFHKRSSARLLDSGLLRFYGLLFDGRLIAVLHTLVGHNGIYCYLQGFDTAYSEFSPGMLLLERVVQDAAREGKSRVDFLRGREAYKYMWGAKDEQTYRIVVHKRALDAESHTRQAA